MNDDFKTLVEKLRIFESSTAMKAIRAIEQSSASYVLKSLESTSAISALRHFEDSGTARMLREIEKNSAAGVLKQLQDSAGIKQLQEFQASTAFKTLQGIQENSVLKSFNRVAEQINAGYGSVTFAQAYEFLNEEYTHSDSDADLDALYQDMSDRAESSPMEPLSAEFYISIFFALVLFIMAAKSSQESDDTHAERLDGLESTTIERIDDLESVISSQLDIIENSTVKAYVMPDRDLNLRHGPSVEHDVMAVLQANQKLKELARDREWINVEFFSYEENEMVSGWVHSKFILPLE